MVKCPGSYFCLEPCGVYGFEQFGFCSQIHYQFFNKHQPRRDKTDKIDIQNYLIGCELRLKIMFLYTLNLDVLAIILNYSSCYQILTLYKTCKAFNVVEQILSKRIPLISLVRFGAISCIKYHLLDASLSDKIDKLYRTSIELDVPTVLRFLIENNSLPSFALISTLPSFLIKYLEVHQYFNVDVRLDYGFNGSIGKLSDDLLIYISLGIKNYANDPLWDKIIYSKTDLFPNLIIKLDKTLFFGLIDALVWLDKTDFVNCILSMHMNMCNRRRSYGFKNMPKLKTIISWIMTSCIFWGRISLLHCIKNAYPIEYSNRIFAIIFHFVRKRIININTLNYIRDFDVISNFTSRQKVLLANVLYYRDVISYSKLDTATFLMGIDENRLKYTFSSSRKILNQIHLNLI